MQQGSVLASLLNIDILQKIYFSLDAITIFKYKDLGEQEDGGWGESGNKQLFFIASEDSTVGSSFKMQQKVEYSLEAAHGFLGCLGIYLQGQEKELLQTFH